MSLFFFFNDTATTEIYTLSLHDALPISVGLSHHRSQSLRVWAHLLSFLSRGRILLVILFDSATVAAARGLHPHADSYRLAARSEEHTSELQSQSNLVCRLLLEKKKKYWHAQSSMFLMITKENDKLRTLNTQRIMHDSPHRPPTSCFGVRSLAFIVTDNVSRTLI